MFVCFFKYEYTSLRNTNYKYFKDSNFSTEKNVNSICHHFISSVLLKLTIEYLISSLKDSGSFLLFLKIFITFLILLQKGI